MTIIICKECGREYSNESTSCPVCAYPNKDKQRWLKNSKKIILFISIILILCLVGILFQSNARHLFGYYDILSQTLKVS